MSFTQFEREITSERTRDKLAALRERGVWATGFRPYGYRLEDRLLIVEEAEAAVVCRVHDLYAKLKSATRIAGILHRGGLRTHRGTPFNETVGWRTLQNRLYCGERAYLGKSYGVSTRGSYRIAVDTRSESRQNTA
ncbi:recombinase family protein [Lichenifustis flavocetrariae]|uniref:recombinase family protein n=1 Tax=Lichenifustis flavocetrariae TaxID=2949735 RepID=UPI003D1355F4